MEKEGQKKLIDVSLLSSLLTKKQVCLKCFSEFVPLTMEQIHSDNNLLCSNCLSQFKPLLKETEFDGHKLLQLYEYKDGSIEKDILISIKKNLDVVLARTLLYPVLDYIHLKYPFYLIVFAPSGANTIRRRGFSHMQEIFKDVKLKKVDCLIKTSDIEQKNLSKEERLEVYKHITYNDEISKIRGKKVLLVDDVYTTGATLRSCVNVLKMFKPSKLKILTIFSKEIA